MNLMRERYQKEIAPALMKAFGFNNVMQVPRVQKVVVNIGIVLQVSGSYVSSKGVDWTACPGEDLYCQKASFIEGGFPVSQDFGGLTLSPSNTLIYWGCVDAKDWVNGMFAWKIYPSKN